MLNAAAQIVHALHCLQAVYYVIRSIWLSAAIVAFVGVVIWPQNAREEMASDVGQNMLLAGQALSGITSCLMPPWPKKGEPEQSRSVCRSRLRFRVQGGHLSARPACFSVILKKVCDVVSLLLDMDHECQSKLLSPGSSRSSDAQLLPLAYHIS